MTTQVYKERRKYERYDSEHYLLYLNEQPADFISSSGNMQEREKDPEPVPGFSYTGNMPDGGTLIKAPEASYEEFVAGLIRLKYTADAENAINANMILALSDPGHERTAEFKAEWEVFQLYREECKENAKAVLA